MDAALQFRELLNQIENSKLNYVITRTPFSANISIKRSLIKFHDKKSSEKEELGVKEEIQTDENVELKNKLVNVSEQNIMFQELLRQQTEKVKALESEMVNLRKRKRMHKTRK